MSDLVGNPKDRFSHNEAHMEEVINLFEILVCIHDCDIDKAQEEPNSAHYPPRAK